MVELSVAEFEKDFDAYMDRIEAGESFLIRQPDGKAVVAVPAGEYEDIIDEVGVEDVDELVDIYSNHEEGS
jgi:PHD/YefM family antitoxin component YafN of YafNO toxin-antitoxin module